MRPFLLLFGDVALPLGWDEYHGMLSVVVGRATHVVESSDRVTLFYFSAFLV